MGPRSAAILASPEPAHRSADGHHPYRANSDVVYLTGFDEPETIALVLPEDHASPFVLFVPKRDPKAEQWHGRRHGVEGAVERFGADLAHELEELDEKLVEYLENIDTLHIAFEPETPIYRACTKAMRALRNRKLKPAAGPMTLCDLGMQVAEMRRCKDETEIALMRESARIAVAGHAAAARTIRAGVPEYVVEAAINHAFRSEGAAGPAYESIVGAGVNATILHYIENKDVIGENEAVLVDAGAEFQYYASDITRTFPSSGRFTPEQRQIYAIVLEAEKRAIEAAKPGVHVREPHNVALRVLIEGLRELGMLTGTVEEIIEDESYKRYFMHGTSHYLGMDTHDVGEYYLPNGDPRPMDPGVVITVEPGIYISADDERAPEAFRGIGIRIEDDVLITKDGNEVLTAACPKELADVEFDLD